MRLVFLIPSKHRHAALAGTLKSLVRSAAGVDGHIVICDQSPERFSEPGPWTVLHRPDLSGLPAARNVLLRDHGPSDLVCFCDDDVRVGGDFARRLVDHAAREPDLDAWGPVVETRGRSVRRLHRLAQLGAFHDPRRLVARRIDRETAALFGCCFAVRTTVAQRHGFDERLTGYALGEDLDFCRRLHRSGHKLRFSSDLRCIHLEEAVGRHDATRRGLDTALLLRRLARDERHGDPAILFHLVLALLATSSGRGRAPATLSGVIQGLCMVSPYGDHSSGS